MKDYFILHTARLLLMIRSPPNTIAENGIAVVSDGSRVIVHCLGSHHIRWKLSSGESIMVETGLTPSSKVYQRNDPTNNEQILFIENFSHANIATYICAASLLNGGRLFSESVFITSGM